MRHYQLTPNLSLILKPCPRGFKWFAGKTNRLALYNLSLCSVELNLYFARNWVYPVWEEEAAAFLSDTDFDVVPTVAADPRSNH